MNANGEKTGGRQKGTPNRVNASMKVRIKDFLFKNEEVMLEAFKAAKPNEKLNFWYKMTNLVCAKQTSSKDDGEWRPGEGIDAEWMTGYERYKKEMEEEEYEYQQLYTEKMKTERETNLYYKEFYKAATELVSMVKNQENVKNIKEQEGEEFWKKMSKLFMDSIVMLMQQKDIYPPKAIDHNGYIIQPKEGTAETQDKTAHENEPADEQPTLQQQEDNDQQDDRLFSSTLDNTTPDLPKNLINTYPRDGRGAVPAPVVSQQQQPCEMGISSESAKVRTTTQFQEDCLFSSTLDNTTDETKPKRLIPSYKIPSPNFQHNKKKNKKKNKRKK